MSIWRQIKRGVIRSGLPPARRTAFLGALLELGRWLKTHPPEQHFTQREDLYRHLLDRLGDAPFDFLEFGVFEGASIRFWSGQAPHADCRFFGFDTFTGLPEDWQTGIERLPEGHFDTGGSVPAMDDTRVQFIKGRFQDTLRSFLATYTPRSPLVIHCDADLYTSTLYVLSSLDPLLVPGTILLFDDFSVATHDFRALRDYTESFNRSFKVLATAETAFEKCAVVLGE